MTKLKKLIAQINRERRKGFPSPAVTLKCNRCGGSGLIVFDYGRTKKLCPICEGHGRTPVAPR